MRSRSTPLVVFLAACQGGGAGQLSAATPVLEVGDLALVVAEDGEVTFTLPLTVEPADAPVVVAIVAPPELGVLTGAGDRWTFVPRADANGEDSFDWSATQWSATQGDRTEQATVTLVVAPVNDPPRGAFSAHQTLEDTPLALTLAATDPEGEPLVFVVATPPEHGDVVMDSTGAALYTPAADWSGLDPWSWTAFDASGGSTGEVAAEVWVAPADDRPAVDRLELTGAEDAPLQGQATAVDPEGDPLTFSASPPAHGVVAMSPSGDFTYTPWAEWSGTDGFDVVAMDRGGSSAPGRVTIVVDPANDPPVAVGTSLVVDEDTPLPGLLEATDPESDGITWRIGTPPTAGTVALDPATGAFLYQPGLDAHGHDAFVVIASDASVASAPVWIGIDVLPVDDLPEVEPVWLLTDEDVATLGRVAIRDRDGDAVVLELSAPPAHGAATIDGPSGDVVYEPDPDWNGTDGFLVVARAAGASSAPAAVTVTVEPAADPPLPPRVVIQGVEDHVATGSVATLDPDGDTLAYGLRGQPQHGTAWVDVDTGLVTYEPTAGWTGVDAIEVRVTDGALWVDAPVPVVVDPDGDGDGLADPTDTCPQVADPLQGDVNGNGAGDACDCWLDRFDDLDPARWEGVVGATVTSVSSSSTPTSLRLAGDEAAVTTVGEAHTCPSYAWSYAAAAPILPYPGPQQRLVLEARVDAGAWVEADAVAGVGGALGWHPRSGHLVLAAGEVTQWRLRAIEPGASVTFLADDLAIACDSDADRVPDCDEWQLAGYDLADPDADLDGWDDLDELLAGSDPHVADSDGDGDDDPADNCPIDENASQSDTDTDGWGDACEGTLFDDFAAGRADPVMWASVTGDAVATTGYARSDTWSMDLGGTATMESLPQNFASCATGVAWELWIKRGPDAPETTDHLYLEVWEVGTGTWRVLDDVIGGAVTPDFDPRLGRALDPALLRRDARIRLRNTGSANTDDFFVDDVTVACDSDGDRVPDTSEDKAHGTDPWLADTDGDGVDDGDELVAGTDPTRP